MITLSLPNDIEARLEAGARKLGIPTAEYVGRLIIDHLQPRAGVAAEDLFAQWEAEDPVVDAADLAGRNQEVDQLSAALNKHRLDSDGPGARLPCPSK